MTTLVIDSSELGLSPTVFGYYALFYGPSGSATAATATLQALTGATNQPIDLGSAAYQSAKIYFFVGTESLGTAGTTQVAQSAIGWTDAENRSYRYDSFEFNLTGSSFDQGNLTSVNGFGIPIAVGIPEIGAIRGYNWTGNQIFTELGTAEPLTVSTYGGGTSLAGQNRMILSPTAALANNLPGYAASDWASYLTSLQANPSQIVVSGYYVGSADGPGGTGVYHNPGYLSYQLSWDGSDFWLKPTATSQIKGDIKISQADLQNSIYSTLGTAYVYSPDGTAYKIDGSSSAMNTGANTQWGEVFTRFLSAFSAGYWGSVGTVTGGNSHLSPVDLSKSWNQDPAYAYGGLGVHTAAGSGSVAVKYDDYAKVFWQHSNSYGTGYSDALTAAFAQGGPLVSLWNGSANVSTINLVLHSDAGAATGYVQPTIYDYLAGPYATPTLNPSLNIGVSFSNGPMALAANTPVTLQYYNPSTDSFQVAQQTVTTGTTANFTFNNVYAANGVNWYQIVVGSGGMAKTFNLYATGANSGFVNPASGFSPQAIQVDGLAVVQAGAYTTAEVTNFNVNLSAGLPSWLLARNTDSATGGFLTPQAPVVGMMSGGLFDQLAAPNANNPTVNHGHLAFGWKGADSAAGNNVSTYTNKISALDVAHVVFAGSGAPVPVTGVADIDGNWISQVAKFGNGTYTAIMTEFLPTDMAFQTPVSNASAPQQFTVSIGDLPINPSSGGNGIIVNPGGGSGATGNWLRFDTTQSSLPNATVLLYTTDANGNLVGREGQTGPGVTLDDAVLGKIGWVASDSGAVLFGGHQSVHLLVGLELHFAIVTGDNAIDRSPGVAITGSGTLGVNITGASGSIQMTAKVDNTLSANAALASSQRDDDHSWVYLDQGSTIHVDTAGSAANVNTLHFVRVDVNAATDAWSVGGVAYGNTDAFRAAVQANWDSGIVQQNGGGTFQNSQNWTVAGADGYYAPVLVTQSGDIFVIGTGNIDGQHHIRNYGENVFGFEDLRADQRSDFDYNDMVMKLSVL